MTTSEELEDPDFRDNVTSKVGEINTRLDRIREKLKVVGEFLCGYVSHNCRAKECRA